MKIITFNMNYEYYSEMKIDAPIDEVFDFFSQAVNLEKITPPWLKFKILTSEPIKMEIGTIIDYRLSLYGFPINWRTKITHWDPPHRFIDSQLKGPYKQWIHEHSFSEVEGGCLMQDKVEYQIHGWIISSLIDYLFVRKDIERIFSFRKIQIEALHRQS
jgi:ligand-binding SRPBCC domain-containing protein